MSDCVNEFYLFFSILINVKFKNINLNEVYFKKKNISKNLILKLNKIKSVDIFHFKNLILTMFNFEELK